MTDAEVIAPPEPYMVGTFALYDLPDGGKVIAYRPQDGESQQIVLPAMLMRMIDKMNTTGERPSVGDIMRVVMGRD